MLTQTVISKLQIDAEFVHYFVFSGVVKNQAYNTKNPIKILFKNDETIDIASASDQLNLQALTKPVEKYYLCFPKKI